VGKQKQIISVAQTRCGLQSAQSKQYNAEKFGAAFVTDMNIESTKLFCSRSYGNDDKETDASGLIP
jgi:hypothetical protein